MPKNIKTCADMSMIRECSVTDCSYNTDKKCHAIAITVGNSRMARCDTFHNSRNKGGVKQLNGGVGACKMDECKFNTDLECFADSIEVALKGEAAICNTFQSA